MDPPADTAPMMPPISIIALRGSMPKVSGISSAMAVVPPIPGTTPKIRPTTTPANRKNAPESVNITCRAANVLSSMMRQLR